MLQQRQLLLLTGRMQNSFFEKFIYEKDSAEPIMSISGVMGLVKCGVSDRGVNLGSIRLSDKSIFWLGESGRLPFAWWVVLPKISASLIESDGLAASFVLLL
jgi:hypothetical protein